MATHLLAFGLNYPGTSSALAGCVNDAKDLAARAKPFAATTTVVTDNKADWDGAHRAIDVLRNRCEEKDIAIVTQSSHGTREKHKGRWVEAVVWSDMELDYDFEMDEMFAGFPCPVLFAGDLCHSGGLPRNIIRPRAITLDRCKTHKIDAPKGGRKLTYLYWAGCKDNEYSYDARFDGRPNGAFTYYMLKASTELKPGANYHDWFMRIAGKRPKGYLPSDEYPQTPIEYGATALKKRKVPF